LHDAQRLAEGGASTTRWGQRYCANLPTEEVFTTPDWRRTEGTVRTTRPVSYGGVLLDGVELRFREGRAELVTAASGADFVRGELAKDPGAPYLGEVALVDGGSPTANAGVHFQHPLYDENVASHIAYGSIRMEPVFMILGQSSATAAALAIDDDVPVQKVDYLKLRQRLLADKQVLAWAPLRIN
jgi:aminopeptidase